MTPAPWQFSVGFLPHKVTVYEHLARDGTLYLRWRAKGNWRLKSLKRKLRTADGKIVKETERWAKAQARAQYERLVAGLPAAEKAATPLTIAEGLARAIDPETGKYPVDTPHRREVKLAMTHAIHVWGADTPWEAIRKADLRLLWRRRLDALVAQGLSGARGAEVTLARVLAVAQWLRDEELIPQHACVAPRHWKQDLRVDWAQKHETTGDPEPKRPRHTLDEMRRILKAADKVDARFALLMALGAELRLGQVRRCRRSDIDLEKGTLTVRASRHKRGTIVRLTTGQLRAVEQALGGYLRELEANCADYPLFPSGQMKGGRKGKPIADPARYAQASPVGQRTILDWFQEAEKLAGVAHQPGRGAFGLRRVAVDAAKEVGISREALKAHGGWSDTQMPDRVYAEQDAEYAQEEAKRIRARIRGEES